MSHLPIPHRPPFLFVDEVLEQEGQHIKVRKLFSGKEDFFKGHYPEYPILPGVIACESIFQAGAILLNKLLPPEANKKIPVLTRINQAKFRQQILPPAELEISAELEKQVSIAYFMKGNIRHKGKLAVQVEYVVSLVENTEESPQ